MYLAVADHHLKASTFEKILSYVKNVSFLANKLFFKEKLTFFHD